MKDRMTIKRQAKYILASMDFVWMEQFHVCGMAKNVTRLDIKESIQEGLDYFINSYKKGPKKGSLMELEGYYICPGFNAKVKDGELILTDEWHETEYSINRDPLSIIHR